MSNIILFSGSNSSTSINTKLVHGVADLLTGHNTEVIDLRDFEPPMYSQDIERESGLPENINQLLKKLDWADVVIVSTPEHNGMPPAFLKNILDWLSRVKLLKQSDEQYLAGKKAIIMSASPGGGGAVKARGLVSKIIGYAHAEIVGEFSLSSFSENFSDGQVVNEELKDELTKLLDQL